MAILLARSVDLGMQQHHADVIGLRAAEPPCTVALIVPIETCSRHASHMPFQCRLTATTYGLSIYSIVTPVI